MSQQPAPEKLSRWDVLKEKLLQDCRIYKVYEEQCQHPSGKQGNFYVIHLRDWVHAIPITADDKIVMVEQYRFATRDFYIEVPSGILESNESPIEGAIRELQEETGYSGVNAKLIASTRPNPALLNNVSHFVLIENCTLTHDLNWDPNEEIVTHLIPIQEAIQMAVEGKITHTSTLSALFFLQNYLLNKKSV